MIWQEKPNDLFLWNNPALQVAVSMTQEHLNTLWSLCQEKNQCDEAEKWKWKRRNAALDTSFAVVLTESPVITTLQSSASMTECKRLKASDLHKEMLHLGWSDIELRKPGGKKYLKMKELHEIMQKKLENLKEQHQATIAAEIEKQLVRPPQLPLLCSALVEATLSLLKSKVKVRKKR